MGERSEATLRVMHDSESDSRSVFEQRHKGESRAVLLYLLWEAEQEQARLRDRLAMYERLVPHMGKVVDSMVAKRLTSAVQEEHTNNPMLVADPVSRRPVDDGRQVERTRAWLLQQVSYQQRAQPSDGYTLGMYDAYRAVLHYIDTASQDEDATPSEEAE